MNSTFNKRTKDIVGPLIQPMNHQKYSDVSHTSEVLLPIKGNQYFYFLVKNITKSHHVYT